MSRTGAAAAGPPAPASRHDPAAPRAAAPATGRAAYRVNPVAKLGALLPTTVALMFSVDWVSATVALVGAVLVLLAAGIRNPRSWLRTVPVWVAAPVTGVSLLLYGRSAGTVYWHFGVAEISDGSIGLALAISLRVLALALPAVLLTTTIDPTELADGLAQVLRLPSRFVLGALAALRLVGLFRADWRSLQLARRARGVADRDRIRRALGQSVALLVLSIRRGSKLATAMEARGFGGSTPRTWARPSRFGRAEWVSLALGLLLAALAVTAALGAGTWNPVTG